MSPAKRTSSPSPAIPAEENPSAFKLWINADVFRLWAKTLVELEPRFRRTEFLKDIELDLRPLELKDRIRLLAQRLSDALPLSFPAKTGVLARALRSEPKLHGFAGAAVHELISREGRKSSVDFDRSLGLLRDLTEYFSSEFAVQPFLIADLARTLEFLAELTESRNVHIRRWVSEGTRPRLPWGIRIRAIQERPEHTIPLLEALRYDDELYVRKSVANHLNDISKDHPERVVRLLRRWKKEAPAAHLGKIEWITRHALRGLIKKGHPGALALFGWNGEVPLARKKLILSSDRIRVGEKLEFCVELASRRSRSAALDFRIYYRKQNGELSPKVFKWTTLELRQGELVALTKRHSFRPVSIRKLYPGAHALGIQLNGVEILRKDFRLLEEK